MAFLSSPHPRSAVTVQHHRQPVRHVPQGPSFRPRRGLLASTRGFREKMRGGGGSGRLRVKYAESFILFHSLDSCCIFIQASLLHCDKRFSVGGSLLTNLFMDDNVHVSQRIWYLSSFETGIFKVPSRYLQVPRGSVFSTTPGSEGRAFFFL